LREKFDSTFANLKDGSAGFKLLMERVDKIDTIMIALKETLENTSNITSDLSKITGNIQSGKGTIGRLLMDQSLAQNFDSSLVNLKQGSEGLKNLMVDAKGSFVQNLDSTFVNLKEGTYAIKILMDKAKKSWLLWGF